MTEKVEKCPICGYEIYSKDSENYFFSTEDNDSYLIKNHDSYTYKIKDSEKIDKKKIEKKTDDSIKYSKVFPFRRFILLMVFTFGLFQLYWFYKNTKLTIKELLKDNSPLIRTILLCIPIANIVVYYYYLKDIKTLVSQNNIKDFSIFWNLIFYLICPILSIWSMINIQESLNEYWRFKQPNYPILFNFKKSEKIVMILIPLFIVLIFIIFILHLTFIPRIH